MQRSRSCSGGKRRAWQTINLTSYYLEYRALIGFDEGMTPQVLVHTGVDPILPTQANPAGVKVWIINASGDANSPAVAGGTFSDPAGGLDIVVKSIDATKAVVEITYTGTTTGDGGAADGGGSSADAGGTAPDAGGGGTDPVICLDGMNTVFVPPGTDECVPIYPPVNPDGGGIVVVDAGGASEASTPVDARPPIDAPTPRDAVLDAGAAVDVVVDTTPPPAEDSGTTTPPPPAEDRGGCGCRLGRKGLNVPAGERRGEPCSALPGRRGRREENDGTRETAKLERAPQVEAETRHPDIEPNVRAGRLRLARARQEQDRRTDPERAGCDVSDVGERLGGFGLPAVDTAALIARKLAVEALGIVVVLRCFLLAQHLRHYRTSEEGARSAERSPSEMAPCHVAG